ncbi:MAG: flavin reductase [Oscillospiraceae bacterium]|nr:flavin reductase [Oscillospiraceae bacterium]
MNRAVFEKLNYGLYVLGVAQDGKDYGCLISSFAQVTSGNPRKCTITVNKDNRTADAILASGTVAVTMVAEGADRDVLKVFGYKSGRVSDKFAGLEVSRDGNGNPYLPALGAAWVSLKVVEKVDIGNFYLFICDAVEGELVNDSRLLTMDEFLEKGKFAAPPTASVYRTMSSDEGWVCPICGYHYEKDEMPEGYICPLCRCPGEKFVKKTA